MPYRAGTVDSTLPAGTVRHGTARVRIGKIYSRAVPYRAGTVKNCQCERSISGAGSATSLSGAGHATSLSGAGCATSLSGAGSATSLSGAGHEEC